ncbi:hypothetical protein NP233_g7264 [Leucocoprinus birnbaumii]|uniref:GAG-pre-integrase domain-containing protein n=1 Tax=Leucocoprinus birnbaumii TaxID=56174 RepID=A0AAD5VS69_9AGAR|nr:hypothetical protein NP233_g7264 [Leucocoprinus birnbaumii]
MDENGGEDDGGGGNTAELAEEDEVEIPFANMLISTNENIHFSSSAYSDRPMSAVMQNTEADETDFIALLDPGSTHHIFRQRAFFNEIDFSKRLSMTMANSSSLQTLGTGSVTIRFKGPNTVFDITLKNCLYAPSAPINLISVGSLNDKGIDFISNDKGVYLHYRDTHPKLPGLTIKAFKRGRLPYINCRYVLPDGKTLSKGDPFTRDTPIPENDSVACVAVPLPSPELWHQRFGHLGKDATKVILTMDYATGIKYSGQFSKEICPPCIIAKRPRHSHPYIGNWATAIGELLHIDTCGPFPVQTPHHERYFFIVLDDYSNFGFTFLLKHKNDVLEHFLIVEAFLQTALWE